MRRVALLFLVGACTTSPDIGQTQEAVVHGTESDESQDATVLVMHYDALAAGGGAASGCSGSLLAPTLVLTARHCVSITDEGAACDASGMPVQGGSIKSDHDPTKLYVFGGKDRPDFLSGNVHPSRGTSIITTGATNLCNNDLALIVLDKPVVGGIIAPIRLDGGPKKSEVVTVVGWGISETENNPPVRRQRTGVVVQEVGPFTDLGSSEFRTTEGTCSGDSGGPAIDPASGAVIGALSRGGNGEPGTSASGCIGATNIYTAAAGHADMIRQAYAKVGQQPWLEGKPMPSTVGGGSAPDSSDGCSASGARRPEWSSALVAFTVAVLFRRRRRS